MRDRELEKTNWIREHSTVGNEEGIGTENRKRGTETQIIMEKMDINSVFNDLDVEFVIHISDISIIYNDKLQTSQSNSFARRAQHIAGSIQLVIYTKSSVTPYCIWLLYQVLN